MHDDPTCGPTPSGNLHVAPIDVDHLRFILREQIAGDAELLREIAAGTASGQDADAVRDRLEFAWGLAGQVGGLFPDALAEAA